MTTEDKRPCNVDRERVYKKYEVTPAYGRDFTTVGGARASWQSGQDWILHDITSRWDGKYCSNRDLDSHCVMLRFNKKQVICKAAGSANFRPKPKLVANCGALV